MNYKIALIADIHGNLPAFEAVLSDIEKENIDHVIIAGDMITDCPDSNEILNIVREMDCTVIKGNREQYFLDYQTGLKAHWNNSRQTSSLIWSFNQISELNNQYIKQLKQDTVLNIYGLNLCVSHGSPDSISELIYPLKQKTRFEEIMGSMNEDILICGHSHKQWHRKIGDTYAVNPGSSGVHFNKKQGAEYSILEIKAGAINVIHKQISYSLNDLKNRFELSGLYKKSPTGSESIIESIRQGENLSMRLLAYANEIMEKRGIAQCSTIPDEIWELAGSEYLCYSIPTHID